MLKAQLDPNVPCLHTQDFEPCMGPGCSEEGETDNAASAHRKAFEADRFGKGMMEEKDC